MSNFLKKDYVRPKTEGDYMKFKLGVNTFRIIGNPVIGFVGWTENEKQEKKPVRREDSTDFADVNLIQAPRFFWGLEVYSYEAKRLQLLEITQSTILDKIELLNDNPQWGDPNGYDIVVTRAGEGLETKYDIQSNPPAEMNNTVKEALAGKRVDLNGWFTGGEAFPDAPISNDPAGEAAEEAPPPTEAPVVDEQAAEEGEAQVKDDLPF